VTDFPGPSALDGLTAEPSTDGLAVATGGVAATAGLPLLLLGVRLASGVCFPATFCGVLASLLAGEVAGVDTEVVASGVCSPAAFCGVLAPLLARGVAGVDVAVVAGPAQLKCCLKVSSSSPCAVQIDFRFYFGRVRHFWMVYRGVLLTSLNGKGTRCWEVLASF